MKTSARRLLGIFLLLFVFHAPATVRHVDLNCTNATPPFTDWSTAATNIQDAIDAAVDGDLILVNDGVYQDGFRTTPQSVFPPSNTYDTNRVVVNKPVTIQSVNGPAAAFISGSGIYRCVYLTNGAALNGFTLISGTAGWVIPGFGRLTSTIIANGGGVTGGQFGGGVISDCVLTGNSATGNGGGAYGVTLFGCSLTGNSATNGGGAASSTLYNCIVTGNSASPIGNTGPFLTSRGYGGGICNGSAMNCLIAGNSAYQGGGASGVVTLNNCSIVNNSASVDGGAFLDGAGSFAYSQATDCLIYFNTANLSANFSGTTFYIDHSCTMPLPASGSGNITNEPSFVNQTGGNYHLQSNSPCINAGNNSYVTTSTDLAGNPRIAGGTVDIGAYEFQSPSSVLSYAWAQQYGLPTDGSADFADTDGDGLNNWQEWIAGTNPTNAASVLKMFSPSNGAPGLKVSWQSVTNRTYYLQRSSDLSAQPAFSSIKSNLVGAVNTTIYSDTTATNGGPYFYRVGVQ